MEVYLGIDWSQTQHEACFMNGTGMVIGRLPFAPSLQGFERLDRVRAQLQVPAAACVVGLETAHNLLLDSLWARGYEQIYVIAPKAVKSSRSRYRQSGARTDQSDAYVLADMLRTDRPRLTLWHPGSPILCQLRAKVSLWQHLTRSIVQEHNRLEAVLWRYYPAALQVFGKLMSQVSLRFIQAYPTPQAAAALSRADFVAFARQQHYPAPKGLVAAYARLQAPQPAAAPAIVAALASEAQFLARSLLHLVQAKAALRRELQTLVVQHPDSPIFASLPGVGDFLTAALLVKFGEDRQRFPTPTSLQALAGTCPVTVHSGKRHAVQFRHACDHEFRHIVQQWARTSLPQSVWAATYWAELRPHCASDSHAFRCLANRWLAIAWKLWQTAQPYVEDLHLQRRAQRQLPRP